jgi:hypothetical protein
VISKIWDWDGPDIVFGNRKWQALWLETVLSHFTRARTHTLWNPVKTKILFKLRDCPCALTQQHAMKVYWGNGGIAPLILDLGDRLRWVVSFTPRPLYPQGKSPWYPLDRRLDGSQSRSERGDEEKNSQPPPEIEPKFCDWILKMLSMTQWNRHFLSLCYVS